ncbi:hypothetical protein JNE51_004439 [Salmonella enterica]|nr:hypothetical protein [Salmonella enterica]
MADLMTALRNAHNAGDTEAATRIAAMIKNQQGGSNAPVSAQEAPQEAQPLPNSNPQPTAPEPATEPQSALERGFNYVGNVAASGGRMIAGGVADVANVGVGALNLVGQGVQAASNAITGENGQYQPIAPAGYGELDQYLMPRGTGEEIAASIPSYVVGGEVVAPIKAAENAGRVARVATSLVNQLPASITGALAENNQGDAGAVAKSTALNAVAGATLEKVGGAAVDKVRNLLPESLGGFSQAEKAANVANPDYVASVLQGGNQEAQQTFRAATTDEAGNSILNPSQVLNTDQGAKYIRAEQRDLTRGTGSEYAQRQEAQKAGDSLLQAAQNTVSGGDVGALQAAAQDTTQAFKDRASTLYNESKAGAQQILDSAPVKITNLKMPETKGIAQQHLDANAATGNINLNAETRRTLTQFNKAEVNSIEGADKWKRTLNEKAQKAYRNGDYTSYQALKDVGSSFKNEMDSTISAIDPQAGKLWKDADNFYSASVGDFGDKSVLGKIAGKDNPDIAANALVSPRNQNAAFNTQQVVEAMRDAVNRGDIATAQQLSQQLGQGLGEATRGEAIRAATTGENFSATKFANTLARLEPQAQAANDLAAIGGAVNDQAAINQALRDVVSTQRNKATVGMGATPLAAELASRGIGGAFGLAHGGVLGAMAGNTIGGKVAAKVNQGLLDRLAGTVKRGNEYVNYLSNPENAQAVADVLAQRGATLENATAQEVKGIIDNIKRGAVGSMLEQSIQQPEPEANQTLPTLPSTPATQASSEPAAPVADEVPQVAQAAKKIGSDKAIDLYKSLASAETGGLDNRFIRTKAAEAGPSTAYGPAQITYSLAKDFAKNHPELFTEKERDYLDRFVGQGKKMLHAAKDDPVYGYGGVGELHSKADQRLYARVAVKMLDYMIADNNGSLDTTVKKWRGANDAKYFAKVASAYKEAKAERKTKRQGWGRPTAA